MGRNKRDIISQLQKIKLVIKFYIKIQTFSHNCEFVSDSWEFSSQNCNFLYHNLDFFLSELRVYISQIQVNKSELWDKILYLWKVRTYDNSNIGIIINNK